MHFGRRFHEDVVHIDPKLRSGNAFQVSPSQTNIMEYIITLWCFELCHILIYNVYSSKYSGKYNIQTLCHVSSFSHQCNFHFRVPGFDLVNLTSAYDLPG